MQYNWSKYTFSQYLNFILVDCLMTLTADDEEFEAELEGQKIRKLGPSDSASKFRHF